ncbi:MAG: sodium-translocating pyrophosphatase, partial [Brooklawnia sp.]|nr:sodium-translocating pyrophosphatase [Brooklawnia sp.]
MTITFGSGSIAIIASAAALAAIALVIALVLRAWILKQPEGSDGMHAIAAAVQEGAQAYLARQLRTLAPIAGVVFVLLFALPGETPMRVGRSVAFLSGAAFSGAIGYLGMW